MQIEELLGVFEGYTPQKRLNVPHMGTLRHLESRTNNEANYY